MHAFFNDAQRLFSRGSICKSNGKSIARALNIAGGRVFLQQQAAGIASQGIKPLAQSLLRIDLQRKVHAAAQIQPQEHGRRAQCS